MDNTKNELNDIILNKGGNSFGSFKKVLLAIATFAVLLIVVIVIMSSLNNNKKKSLTTTPLPPQPTITEEKNSLFRSVEVGQEQEEGEQKRLESIAQEIKNQTKKPPVETTLETEIKIPEFKEFITPKKDSEVKRKTNTVTKRKTKNKVTQNGKWYVQVGSFQKNNPRTYLINKITKNNYSYTEMKSVVNGQRVTKVLIGPFESFTQANTARKTIMKKIEPAAFVYQAGK